MTPQEQQLLHDLFQRLAQARGTPKDAQAEAEVRQGLVAVPDAAYWLAQRTLLLEQGLQQAQQQIAKLQQLVAQGGMSGAPQGGGSFLSGGLDTQFGRAPERDAERGYGQEPESAGYRNVQPQQAPGWRERWFGATPRAAAPASPAVSAAAPAASVYAAAPPTAPSAGSSFLSNAAASAAGVAGGMFLFNGLENLLGGHHGSGSGLFGGGNSGQPAVQENITQNFYGESGGSDQLARDAGRDNIFDAAGSDSFDGGDYFDDDNFP
ncbi:hypothetical protein GCM10010975_31490 [Comamonas phosphati]|nr:hypothetical protein GCM10010975_31490 [Comamonas phosphati]